METVYADSDACRRTFLHRFFAELQKRPASIDDSCEITENREGTAVPRYQRNVESSPRSRESREARFGVQTTKGRR